jgi:hypothetical protein
MGRTCWILVALMAFGRNGDAADVTAYVTAEGTTLTYAAKAIATSVFKNAGVGIDWRGPKPPVNGVPATWLRIELSERTPPEVLPGALAVSHPYAGCSKRITVFVDRIRSLAHRPDDESALLAYVLVHEISHVIQGVERHSDAGIMKAHWSPQDRAEISARRLGFADEDMLMLRNGLTHWASNPASLTHPSEAGIASHPD